MLEAIRAGSRDAFETFYARHRQTIRQRIRKLVREESAVDDVMQETFVSVWTKSASWDGSGAPAAWLYRIATNLALNHLRSRSRRNETRLDQSDDEGYTSVLFRLESNLPGPDAAAEREYVIRTIRKMIDALPESKREVMELVHTEDLSIAEVAETLGIPSGTVKSRLHYGRLTIEENVREFFQEEE